MTHIESAHPENDVFGNIRGMVGDSFEVPGRQHKLHSGTHERHILRHVLQYVFKDPVAVLIHNVVAFENLCGHFRVPKNHRSEAAADHGSHGFAHGGGLL